MLGELNKAMSGVKLFAFAGEADVDDCVLVDVDVAAGVVVLLLAEGAEFSVLKRDANLLWKEDMSS